MGTPIKIEFREGNNPFEGKKANLTLAQQRKRRRMMSYYKDKK
jgi:GTP-binding protein